MIDADDCSGRGERELRLLADATRIYRRAESDRHTAMRRAVAAGATLASVAEAAGVSSSTVRRMVGSDD